MRATASDSAPPWRSVAASRERAGPRCREARARLVQPGVRQRPASTARERSGVGGHPVGRICRRAAPPPGRPHGEPGRLEVGAGGLAPHTRRLLDPPKRPAQPPKCQNFLSFVVAQDVGHAGERDHTPARRVKVLSAYPLWPGLRCPSMAGFGCRPRGIPARLPPCVSRRRAGAGDLRRPRRTARLLRGRRGAASRVHP